MVILCTSNKLLIIHLSKNQSFDLNLIGLDKCINTAENNIINADSVKIQKTGHGYI